LRRILLILVLVVVLGAIALRVWRGPDPAEILARIEIPPAPVLSPAEEQATFRTAPGFRVELVAAEPLVVDPVAIDWDDEGRLYVVEMRGFMPDIEGRGEDRPVGRIVVLEDTDADGQMDDSHVFLEGLVLPRAIAVLPEGVLVGVPPDLWLCRDTRGDRSCGERTRLSEYAAVGSGPEHQENGLLAGLDGWLYNAKSKRRFRLQDGDFRSEPTIFRGQWGIAQDDSGRLFYNHNSGFLYADVFPAEYSMRQPGTALRRSPVGLNVPLAADAQVFAVRVAPGLNRAYLAGSLRRDGRQAGPTGVSGLAIQRGHQYGAEWVGDAFVPEAAGSAVAHFAVEGSGTEVRAEHRLYDDDDFGSREFLVSTDERFRPVDAEFGPDGAIWLIDMYRGVIQHADYVSDYLRAYVARQQLGRPGATGRIWRIVREDLPIERRPPSLANLTQQLEALDHANGWVRDRAQRRIVHEAAEDAAASLRRLEDFGPLGRRHALWALEGLAALDERTWRRALADPDPETRKLALRLGEQIDTAEVVRRNEIAARIDDPDPGVRLQVLHSLGSLPRETRPLARLLERGRAGGPLVQQAVLSGLSGVEFASLRGETLRGDAGEATDWLRGLAVAAHQAARLGAEPRVDVPRILDLVESSAESVRIALLEGIVEAQRAGGGRAVELLVPHPLFAPERTSGAAEAAAILTARSYFTWPGDPTPGGARPLSPREEELRQGGAALFAQTCAACHGESGAGIPGLAPSLVGSTWVRDSDDWLARIVLDGLMGPVRIDDVEWNLSMPGHAQDPRFDDDAIAGLLTYLRRAWGHADAAVSPETVARIRSERAGRALPWTLAELHALSISHRLDRYAGIYAVPIVGIELEVKRVGSTLAVGLPKGPSGPLQEIGPHLFSSEELMIQFEADASGQIEAATAVRDGTSFPLSRKEE
jgi:mono/diheme cytochrome c family protein/glucose/arabinose dehydrogenase